MAGAEASTSLEITVYASAPAASAPTAMNESALEAFAVAANRVPTQDLPDWVRSANTISRTLYGESTERSKPGASTAPEVSLVLDFDRTNPRVVALMDADNGQYVQIVLQFKTGEENITWRQLVGQISGDTRSQASGSFASHTVTFTVFSGPTDLDKS